MEQNTLTNEELMLLCGKGDKKCLEILIERHNKPLINYFYKLLGNAEDSRDFTQQTFMKIYEKAKSYKVTAKFTTWMLSLIHI